MGLVDDAFAKLKSNLEITKTEQALASRRQNESATIWAHISR